MDHHPSKVIVSSMLRIWKTIVVLVLVVSSSFVTTGYRMNNEPLSRQGCIWSSNRLPLNTTSTNSGGSGPIPTEISLDCNVRTLNTEFWNYTFSPEQRLRTKSLNVKCNDKLYFESHLKLNQSFSQLTHLSSFSFDSCKIRRIPQGILRNFDELRSLRIQTHNSDWSPSIGLEIEGRAFDGLRALTFLDLSSSNIWNLPDSLLCPSLNNLLKFNLSSNRLIEIPDEFSESDEPSGSASCALNVQNLDLSRNTIRRIGSNAFTRFKPMTQLRLQLNLIEELEDTAFSKLGQLKFLNLSSNRLVALPPSIFKSNPQLRELYLQNNSITALSPTVFSTLDQLVMLDLSMNALSSLWIKENVFSGLGHLIVLKLSYNQLAYIDPTIFGSLVKIQALHLDNNRIEAIHPQALSSLTNLQLLDISRNRLSILDGRLLASNLNLQSLYLDHNKISTMGDDALDNCTKLQDLGLAGNNLVQVPSALRTGLKFLRTLDIGENRIASISNESFQGLDELYGLRLVDNRLIELPAGFCSSLLRLRVLNLAQNRLNKISPSAFTGCRNLRALRLDTNNLEEIPPSLSPQLTSLLWLNVSENRIRWADYHLLPKSIEWLDLSHNHLESLGGEQVPRNIINNPNSGFHLRVLDVSHNRLTSLDIGIIPPSLETLRVNHNQLSTIAPDTFSASTHLRRIELVGNSIQVLPLSAISIPPVPLSKTLPEIFLGGNPFMCDCTMEWLTRVNQFQLTVQRQYPRIMDLESMKCRFPQDPNTLIPVPDATPSKFLCPYTTHCFPLCHCCEFEACDCLMACPSNCTCLHDSNWGVNIVSCSNLDYVEIPSKIPMEATELYLDGNEISSLGSHIFIGKKNLRSLFLNGSSVEHISNKTFNGLKSLEVLRLEDNLLTQLAGWEFSDLGNLRELYLENNRLGFVSGETFSKLQFLQILRLDGNHLLEFNIWELSGNGYLRSLSLTSNPWSCECEFVIPFRSWISARNSIAVDFNLATCQRGESDNELVSLNAICNNPESMILGGGGVNILSNDEFESNSIGPSSERAVLITNQDSHHHSTGESDESINYLPMDTQTSVMWAIILSSGVAIVLILALIAIFRKEICNLLGKSRQGKVNNGCCSLIGGNSKKSSFSSTVLGVNGCGDEDESEKLFDAYFIYNSEDEDLLRDKLIPELDENKGTRNRYRLCLHRDLCLGLENPWNLEMMLSAAGSSKRVLIFLSKTFLQKEWTNNSDFRIALQSVLSRHQKKLIFILLPPLSLTNLPSLLTIFPELLQTNPLHPENLLQWTDPSFRSKIKKILPQPTNTNNRIDNFPVINTIQRNPQNGETEWPYLTTAPPNRPPLFLQNILLKTERPPPPPPSTIWSHHHFHSQPPFYSGGPMIPISSLHHPIMFPGPVGPQHHNHEHQNSVSTISNTYPPLTEQNLSDSTNTLGSLASSEHLYSTLDTPVQSPHGSPSKFQVSKNPSQGNNGSPPGGHHHHQYFV